jgi:hypothetical protein
MPQSWPDAWENEKLRGSGAILLAPPTISVEGERDSRLEEGPLIVFDRLRTWNLVGISHPRFTREPEAAACRARPFPGFSFISGLPKRASFPHRVSERILIP